PSVLAADVNQPEEGSMVTTLAEILPHAAECHGDGIALIVEDREFSFRDLDSMSNQVANGLAASGVRPGDRVSLLGANSWEWLLPLLRVGKTGPTAHRATRSFV